MSEQITTETNPKTSLSTKEVIAYLCEKFPLCFIAEGEAKPLKIGLFADLAEAFADDEKISKTLLRQALRVYTLSWRYLHACREGAIRVDLQGNEVGVVDAQQAEHSAKTLAESKEAYSQRKQEQRKAERKAFFKQKAKEENAKKRSNSRKNENTPKASLESLTALENKFSKDKKIAF